MAAAPWMPAGLAGGIHSRLLGFVKTALLRQLVPPDATVCDLFCGRGLDTERWAEAGIGRYVGVDLSASALEEAREQWEQLGRPFPAEFWELDPCMADLEARLQDQGVPADVVCCLAHLQDAFISEDMVKGLLKNVDAVLKPGGFFFGTVPDSSTIWYKYQKAVEGALKAGSLKVNGTLPPVRTDTYKITFDDDGFNAFGSKYHMRFTDDGLPAQPQLLVHFPSLIRLAKEVGLEYVEIQNLWEFYDDHSGPYADVLRSCCGSLVDIKGVPLLDGKGRLNSQALDVLSLYTTFIFKKGDSSPMNIQVSPISEHAANSASKYLTNFPSQHFETFSTSMKDGAARKQDQVNKADDHGSLASTNPTVGIFQHSDYLQQDLDPRGSDTHVAAPVEDLPDSAARGGLWHDQDEGMSELMLEVRAGHKRNEDVGVLGSHEGQLSEPQPEGLKKKHSSHSDGSLVQMGTVHKDSHDAAKHNSQLAVGEAEFRTWPMKDASCSGTRTALSMERENAQQPVSATKGHRTSTGQFGPPTLIEQGSMSAMEVENLEESSPADHNSKEHLRRTNENVDESSSGENHLKLPQTSQSPKHYTRRANETLEESSSRENHQQLASGDHMSKHYLRRTHENQEDGSRRKKQQEPALADPSSKLHMRRTHEILDRGTRRDMLQEPAQADLASKHYERRTNERLDERSRTEKQLESSADNSSKHYMRRSNDSSAESKRSEQDDGEKSRANSGRSKWASRSNSQQEFRSTSLSSDGDRSSQVFLNRFPPNSSKPATNEAFGDEVARVPR